MTHWVVIAILALIALAWAAYSGRIPLVYRDRACGGRAWREAFPDASKDEIREFLQIFVKSFSFPRAHRLKFLPSDKLMGIYRTLYPDKWMADGMELEDLSMSLEDKYGLDVLSMYKPEEFSGVTLGMLFQHARAAARRNAATC